jgi:HK97 family phage major capsid protein
MLSEDQKYQAVLSKRNALAKDLAGILQGAENQSRRNLLASEQRSFDRITDEVAELDVEIERMEAADAREQRGKDFAERHNLGGAARVTREASVYRPDGEHGWVRDMVFARRGDAGAIGRLERNNQHVEASYQERAISTTAGAGGEFVPPKYLEEDWIAFVRPGRPVFEASSKNELPAGTNNLILPKVASGTATAIQGTQNTAIQQTDLTSTSISAPVITLAGGQTLSLQLLEQSPVNTDRIVLQDLAADYAKQCGNLVLNGTGTGGQPLGILNVPGLNSIVYTDASPAFIATAGGKLYNKIAAAVNAVQTGRYAAPTAIIMSPLRWNWIRSQVDAQGRPVLLDDADAPMNAVGTADASAVAQGVVGHLFGLPVLIDNAVPQNLGVGTNQDVIIVAKMDDIWTWESHLRMQAYEQTYATQLSIFCRSYNYLAIQPARYAKSISVISGTGMVVPTL